MLSDKYAILDSGLAKDVNVNELLEGEGKKLVKDSLYMQIGLISVIGLLYVAPESVSKWTDEQKELSSLPSKWNNNISAGPVVDEDEWAINYIGHPVSGAAYYTVARNNGYGWFGSFMYSFFVSTFVWEYGYEAFAEIPSVQDLFSTPVVGSFMGEGMYFLEKVLDQNGGYLYGSRTLGNIAYAFLNPFGRMAESLSDTFGVSTTMRFQTYHLASALDQNMYNQLLNKPSLYSEQNYGVVIKIEF